MVGEITIIVLLVLVLAETSYLAYQTLRKAHDRRTTDKIFVDTSTLIDGRILSVAQTGFITDDLLIPRSVLRELQLLADGNDSDKRARARFGLDVVNELERTVEVNAMIYNDTVDRTPVDERLIELAKREGAAIMTNDFNLNKVASAEGIRVLNINDLALTMRTEYLPGEKARIKVKSKGQNRKQGVGYMPDGTMVVIEEAGGRVGTELEVEVIRFLQTPAGKMLFARPVGTNQKPSRSSGRHNRQRRES
jgi:uncharacterized protein YacL